MISDTMPYMRILFILTHYSPYIGGSEEVFRRLAEGLAEKGHSVKVLTTLLQGTPEIEEINGVLIQRCRVPNIAYQFLFTVFSLIPSILSARDCDIIHTSSNYGALAAFLASRLNKKPLIFTCHEVLGRRWQLVEKRFGLGYTA